MSPERRSYSEVPSPLVGSRINPDFLDLRVGAINPLSKIIPILEFFGAEQVGFVAYHPRPSKSLKAFPDFWFMIRYQSEVQFRHDLGFVLTPILRQLESSHPDIPKAVGITSEIIVIIAGKEQPVNFVFLDSAPSLQAQKLFPEQIRSLCKLHNLDHLIISSSRKAGEESGDDFHAIIYPPIDFSTWREKMMLFSNLLGEKIVHMDNIRHAVFKDERATLRISTDGGKDRLPYPCSSSTFSLIIESLNYMEQVKKRHTRSLIKLSKG
jgi:hypothetical protein